MNDDLLALLHHADTQFKDMGDEVMMLETLSMEDEEGNPSTLVVAIPPKEYLRYKATVAQGAEMEPETFGKVLVDYPAAELPKEIVEWLETALGYNQNFMEEAGQMLEETAPGMTKDIKQQLKRIETIEKFAGKKKRP